jgi:isopropylmalate/homocitrate/citramalate synthase
MSRSSVTIREVGPREALQAHAEPLGLDRKLQLLKALIGAGVTSLNTVSLVSPVAMPHMADAEELLRRLGKQDDVCISALAPNDRGMARAVTLAAEGLLDEVFMVHTPSVSVLKANGFGVSLEENLKMIERVAAQARDTALRVGVFVSASFGCSMEGRIEPERVLATAEQILALDNVDEIVISDSTGQADPFQVSDLLDRLAPIVGDFPVSVHLHDSRGAGLANAVAAIQSPISDLTLDCSFGGLGGDIPFIPEAAGNVATEDIVAMFDGMGIITGINAPAMAEAARQYSAWTGVPLRSRVSEVPPVPWKQSPIAA